MKYLFYTQVHINSTRTDDSGILKPRTQEEIDKILHEALCAIGHIRGKDFQVGTIKTKKLGRYNPPKEPYDYMVSRGVY